MTSFEPGAPGGVVHSTSVAATTATSVQSAPPMAIFTGCVHGVPAFVSLMRVPPLVAPLSGLTTNES